jgi:hypothetical protein
MFNKTDWTVVPPDQEKSAIVNADLEVETEAPKPKAQEYLESINPKPTARARIKKETAKK